MDLYALTDNAILEQIAKTLRNCRLEQNISQKDLAKKSGVSLSSIISLEKGQSVSLATFIPLLRSLNALHFLDRLTAEPEISPIAYAKILEGQNKRKRASVKRNIKNNESEW